MSEWSSICEATAQYNQAALEYFPDPRCVAFVPADIQESMVDAFVPGASPFWNAPIPVTLREGSQFQIRTVLPGGVDKAYQRVEVSLMCEPLDELGRPTRMAVRCKKHDDTTALTVEESQPGHSVLVGVKCTSACCNTNSQKGMPRARPFWLKFTAITPNGDKFDAYSLPFKVIGRESFRKLSRQLEQFYGTGSAAAPAAAVATGVQQRSAPAAGGAGLLDMSTMPRSELNGNVPRVLNEHEAMNLWIQAFGSQSPQVLWTNFRQVFPILSHPRGNLTGSSGHLLRHLLTEQPARLNVVIDRVSQLFQFLGASPSEEELLARLDRMVYPLVRATNFFGFLDRATSLQALQNAPVGSYVIRFSSHPEGPGSLTIDYTTMVNNTLTPAHTRVTMKPDASVSILVGTDPQFHSSLPDMLNSMSYLFKQPIKTHSNHVCAPEYVSNPADGPVPSTFAATDSNAPTHGLSGLGGSGFGSFGANNSFFQVQGGSGASFQQVSHAPSLPSQFSFGLPKTDSQQSTAGFSQNSQF